jgi:DNA-binding CsgD family transcriptional regulator
LSLDATAPAAAAEAPRSAADLERKARELATMVRAVMLGEAAGGEPADPNRLGAELRDVAEELRVILRDAPSNDRRRSAVLCELLVEATELGQDLREHAVMQRFKTLGRIHEGLARMRELNTAAELIDAVPEELCRCCDFDRAIISRVRGSTWVVEQLYVTANGDMSATERLSEQMKGLEVPLSTTPMETEMLRRKAPALVSDAGADVRVPHPLMSVARSRGYVAAPIMPTGRVIGFLHADTFGSGRPLTAIDRDNLWTFGEGFGLVFERTVLLERLDEQRTKANETFESASAFIDELWGSEVRLARHEPEIVTVAETATSLFAAPRESRINALLTPREREVLQLMVAGETNSNIADQLVISEGTVKSHVKHILHKLRVSNRAEAVSRYLQLQLRQGQR